MRPIHLSVSGLHSFREKQDIDFETLREVGVFGIFGPTGSGKSSILDAMTLALYGKVERATNNTQGIMNHAEDSLSVQFTFEIGQGSERQRYRVERTYKRTDQLSVRTSVCRLTEVGDEDVVLADKERDVTGQVQQILGLTIDDFTRAVVLPQGKFAEFLSLRGSERRKMLERLFHLELYGERLNRRLKEKLESAKRVVKEIEAGQAELGAASEEDVQAARVERIEAEKQFERSKQQLKESEDMYTKQKQLWEWQLEKQEILNRKQKLENEQNNMAILKRKLEKAEEAERVNPYFIEWKKSSEAVDECERKYSEIQEALQSAENETKIAKLEFENIRNEREQKLPVLVQQIEKLKFAQQLEQNYAEVIREKDKLKQHTDTVRKNLEAERSQVNDKNETLQRAINKQSAIDEKMKAITISNEERTKVQQAVFDKRELDSLYQALNELDIEYEKKQASYKEKCHKYEEQLKQLDRQKENAHSLFQDIEAVYMRAADVQSIIEQQRNKLLREKDRVQESIEKARLDELARELYTQLKDGEPCPVCGSTTHKQDESDHLQQSHTLQTEQLKLKQLENSIDEMNENENTVLSMLSELKQLSQIIYEKMNVHLDSQQIKKNHSPDQKIDDINSEVKMLEQDILLLNDRAKSLQQQFQQLERQHILLKSELTMSEESATEVGKKRNQMLEEYEQRKSKWELEYRGKALDEIETELENIQKRDEELIELTKRYETSVKFITDLKAEIEKLKESVSSYTVKLEIGTAELTRVQEEIKKKHEQIRAISGEHSPTEELNKVEQQLQHLQVSEKQASEKYEKNEVKQKELHHLETSIRERLNQLIERKTETTTRWNEQLTNSSFNTIEELEEALVEELERKNWTSKIVEFEESLNAVNHDLARMNKLLENKQVSEEQWEQTQQQLALSKQQFNDAFKMKSEADYQYKHILKQHERFKQLEDEREKIQTVVTQLSKLESVFRGNAFVEFMAEEQLMQVTRDASARLARLTNERYAIEVNSEGGFVIRDDANGGVKRPVSTLSGGETFLTSLALALSLSSHIQLRGKFPLEFFFLDEGFGTLDQELLETVITSLEKLHMENVSIGIISHVPELKARLARKLIVHAAEPAGNGSRITMTS